MRCRQSMVGVTAILALTMTACGDGDDGAASTTAAASAPEESGASTTTAAENDADEPQVITGAGDIEAVVQEYRDVLGPNNGGAPGGDPEGYREIDWDSVPDEFAAPNELPPHFFNDDTDPRARGAVLETPGDHVAVSADPDNPSRAEVRFGDVNPTYPDEFTTFSDERLFSPIGSNVVDLTFAVTDTGEPGVVNGFGAVYTDVDREENTAFEYFDADGHSLGQFATPVSEDGLSFLGVVFADPVIARVRIEYGDTALGPDEGDQYDVAVMDNFIYGEPLEIS